MQQRPSDVVSMEKRDIRDDFLISRSKIFASYTACPPLEFLQK
ncbi:MAG: hypothetical protein VB140_09880 [Burkholderia sp.]